MSTVTVVTVTDTPTPHPLPTVITLTLAAGGLIMTKRCALLQLMVPLVVWLCEKTERSVRA